MLLADLKMLVVYFWRRLKMRLAQSTWGFCLRCARPWGGKGKTAPHQTWFGKKLPHTKGTFGIFPLCEECWKALGTYERRVPFYRRLQRMWVRDGASEDLTQWSVISAALKKESEEAA